MDRRSFLASMLAAAIAPAFVRPSSLMRIKPIEVPKISTAGCWLWTPDGPIFWDKFATWQLPIQQMSVADIVAFANHSSFPLYLG